MDSRERPATLLHALSRRVEEQPDRPALTWLNDKGAAADTLTYAELVSRAHAVAARLRESTTPGDRALLLFGPGLDFVWALLGCFWAGVIAVPAYPPRNRRHHARLDAIRNDAAPRCLLTGDIGAAKLDEWLATAPPIERIDTSSLDLAIRPAGAVRVPAPGDLALLQYTSGSTALPKGVMVTHANISHNSECLRRAFRLHERSVSVSWLPSFHDMGLIDGVLQPLSTGFAGYLMSPSAFVQRPQTWLEAVSRFGATHCGGPNFGFDACVQAVKDEEIAAFDFDRWETVYNGAEPVRNETLEAFTRKFAPARFHPRQWFPCYGLAEGTLIVTGVQVDAEPSVFAADAEHLERHRVREAVAGKATRHLVGCGSPVLDTTVVVVDPESFSECAEGSVGEIWAAGPSIAAGYWNNPAATESAFNARLHDEGDAATSPRRFLRTGDLGFVRDGELYVAGRIKDLVIVRGRNHYPQDIESTASGAHPSLARALAAAFSVDVSGEERLVVVQEVPRTAAHHLDSAGVLAAIRAAIVDEHEVDPWDVVLVPTLSLPRTSSGKLQRRESRRRLADDEFRVLARQRDAAAPARDAPAAPRTPAAAAIADRICAALAEVLPASAAPVDRARPFASLGLDSLAAVRLAASLERWLGRAVPPTSAYDYPTVDALAAHLAGETPQGGEGERPSREEDAIAIVGIGCRVPGARGADEFWRLLRDGRDGVRDVPPGRWDTALYDPAVGHVGTFYTKRGGFLDEVGAFDAGFFDISPKEAARMDPQQRLLLETVWEACEDAGIPAPSLEGTETGVFFGISTSDYRSLQFGAPGHLDQFATTGNAASIAANRISYLLNLQGPSLTVDTACSSSLLAVHLACESLRRGECGAALAGGVNLMLTADLTVAFCQARMLSPDGRCKTFDASADGYIRGEGCGVVLLKPLARAIADGDRIAAVILGSAVNQDGRTNGLTAPNGVSQQRVLRKAIAGSGVKASDVHYVEAHGTGTALGDPIEMQALCAVYGAERRPEQSLYVGSVKTNIGHLEAAAGVIGLIKAALSLRERTIPAHLHFERLNAAIDLGAVPIEIPARSTPWPASGRACAAVSSFGFGGTNVHAILAAAPVRVSEAAVATPSPALRPLLLSAKSPAALEALVGRYRERLLSDPSASFDDVAFTALAGRAHFPVRTGFVASNLAEMGERLAASKPSTAPPAQKRPTIAFLYTGQGSQYAAMGAALYAAEPAFRACIDRLAAAFGTRDGFDLVRLLTEPGEAMDAVLARTKYTQPVLFALQRALTALWRSWGIEPDAVIGHSVGEFAAACAAGVFDEERGLAFLIERGRLMEECASRGSMAAVSATRERVESLAARAGVDIAACNAPNQVVVAGAPEAIARLLAECGAAGVRVTPLNTTRAFHSSLMDALLPELERAAARLDSRAPRVRWISNLTGKAVETAPAPGYWREHARQPVRFGDGVSALAASGIDVLVEVGPDPVLLALAARTLRGGNHRSVASMDRRADPRRTLAEAVVSLYTAGATFDARGLFPTGRRVAVPAYPFARDRHWFDAGVAVAVPAPVASTPNMPQHYEVAWERVPQHVVGPEPPDIRRAVAAQESALRTSTGTARYPEALDALESVAVDFAAAALGQLEAEHIAPRHQRLAARLRATIAAHGGSQPGGDDVRARLARYPEVAHEATLLNRCGPQLAGVLAGRVDPLALLFPAGDLGAAGALYRDAAVARLMNGQAAAALQAYLAARDATDAVRILEVGAGTGGLTAHLLPVLAAWGGACEYVFTDVSPVFLERARQQFAAYPFVRYELLDVERADGGPSHCDLIVAANAIHAVARLESVLTRLHGRLRIGGQLWLLEGVRPQTWLDLTFGLTTGWWNAADGDGRSDYPLLPVAAWCRLLESTGFDRPLDVSASADVAPYALIAATRSDAVAGGCTRWIWAASTPAMCEALAATLPAGASTQVDAGSATLEREIDRALAAGRSESPARVLLCLETPPTWSGEAAAREAVQLSSAFAAAVRAVNRHAAARLWVVTRGARLLPPDAGGPAGVSAASVLWGLANTASLEIPDRWGGIIDLEAGGDARDEAQRLVVELLQPFSEDQQVWRGAERWVPRLSAAATSAGPAAWPPPRGAVLITGGTGALGLEAAVALAHGGWRDLYLMSRHAGTAPAIAGATLRVVQGDAADATDVTRVLETIRQDGHALKGIVHAAGIPHVRPLGDCTAADFESVYRAKVRAPLVLLEHARDLDFCITFSSMVALWGAKGQGAYAAGNLFLDGLAFACRKAGIPATTINWGPVSGGGMVPAAELESLASMGVHGLPRTSIGDALTRVPLQTAQTAVLDIEWDRFKPHLEARGARPFFARVGARPIGRRRETVSTVPGRSVDDLVAYIRAQVAATLGHRSAEEVDTERGFFEIGLDSLTIIQLKSALERELGLELPATLALEYPTVVALARHIHGSYGAGHPVSPGALPAPADVRQASADVGPGPAGGGPGPADVGQGFSPADTQPVATDDRVAIVGIGCRFPGGVSDPASFWRLLQEGVDAVGPLPAERWSRGPHIQGGFLSGVDRFDAPFFGISAREATNMDPQQRLLLEVAWEALEDAGAVHARSEGAKVGVFVGVSASDYARRLSSGGAAGEIDAYYATGNALNAAAGRISFLFGFNGPAMAIDTACSSSLVALRLACQSVAAGDCESALAGGVNLILSPETTRSLERANVLSPGGRCRTFSAGADGMGRAEGCGLVLLKPLARALADRDRIYAVVRSAAINQDGASGGFTVPSRAAQEALIRRALDLASVPPASIDYVEAHGTGTPLGDPIEVHALAAVFGSSHAPDRPLRIGSVKTNFGHTESASGIAGVIKTALALHHGEMPPQIHFDRPSPHIEWDRIPLQVVTRRTAWPRGERPRRAGVSSFGLSGTNAHVILEEAPLLARRAAAPGDGLFPVVLSAKTGDALADARARLARFLRQSPDTSIHDLSYTLTARRAPLACRWAVTCASTGELISLLEGSHAGDAAAAAVPDWSAYWHAREGRVVSLPPYAFQEKSYWKALDADEGSAEPRDGHTMMKPDLMLSVDAVRREVVHIVAALLEEEPASIEPARPFLEMGADSIVLTEAVRAVERRFGVALSIRQMFESLTTIDALAEYVAAHQQPIQTSAPDVSAPVPLTLPMPAVAVPANWEKLVEQQFQHVSQIVSQVVQQQLEFLRGGVAPASSPARASLPAAPAPTTTPSAAAADFWRHDASPKAALTPGQQSHVDALIERYAERTRTSKSTEAASRQVFADMRTAIGFRLETKEISYPIVAARSEGSAFWDVDGNRYVDMCMGFGVDFFGHQPPFVMRALADQMREGLQVGPQSRDAAEVARLICQLTGMERVTFCNSGTEAVMTAIRVARAATGRQKIVTFSGSYHGHSDATLALAGGGGRGAASVPMAPGVSPDAIKDTLVLPYDVDRSLEIIDEHAASLAAVLVEPVQSRRPGLHPGDFLRRLRALTTRLGVPLIFDEMITGFRIHPGGAQAHFGVVADIATYGKLIGGGMPLGVVAARGGFLDRIDGGTWRYGDDSAPSVERTFYAGTFCKHPLAMAAARAVLSELVARGPALQEDLNQKTADLAASLNEIFADEHVPLNIVHFGSLMRFNVAGNFTYLFQPLEMDLFCHHLIDRGVYIWEGRTLFLSTAHSAADLDTIRHAVRSSVREMKAAGFFAGHIAPSPSQPSRTPLSESQRDVWVLAQMGADGSNAYHEQMAVDVDGSIDPAAFTDAVEWLVDRHEALRITIDNSGVEQTVHRQRPLALRIEDLTSGADTLEACMAREADAAFDLVNGPLFRVRLWKTAAERSVIALFAHHIVADGWTMGILLNELASAYAAFAGGRKPGMPPAPRFTDYLRARDARLASAPMQAHRAYWTTRLAAPLPALDLPADRSRPPVKTFSAFRSVATLPPALGVSLRKLSASHGCSLFMTMLAGYAVLLHRLSGGPDEIIVGVPVAGRNEGSAGQTEADAHVAGFCTHMLPLRLRVDAERPFAELLQTVRTAVLDAFDHQAWPLGRTLDDIAVDPDPSRTPVFTTTFNLDRPLRLTSFAGMRARLRALPVHYAAYDLACNLVSDGDDLVVSWDANRDLWDEATVERWIGHYGRLLQAGADDPTLRVEELPLLETAERRHMLVDWNSTNEPLPHLATLHEWVEEQAGRTPDAEAIRCGEQTLTFAQLSARANLLAGALRAHGAGRGQLVGVSLPRSTDLIATLLAVLKTGAAYVPLDPRFPSMRLRRMIGHSGMRVIVTDTPTEAVLEAALTPDIELIHVDAAHLPWRSDGTTDAPASGDDAAYVMYTSASTGEAKGVVVTHRSVINLLATMARRLQPQTGEAWLAVTTISFDISVLEIFLPLVCGFRLVVATEEECGDGRLLAHVLERERITFMQATPAGWRLLLESGWPGSERMTMLCGGEALPGELARLLMARGRTLWNVYGPTETTIWSTAGLVTGESLSRSAIVSIGRPIGNTQIYILDENGHVLPPGVHGELYIGGAGVARGYHRDEVTTRDRFLPNPLGGPSPRLYRTGDLARWLPDGTLEFLGRLDHQVKLRGFRIELGEIETWLARCAGIAEAVAAVHAAASGEQRLVGYVVPQPGVTPDVADLRRHLALHVPDYMTPDTVVCLDRLPRTPNGKIDRRALPAPVRTPPAVDSPLGPTEAAVADALRDVLQLPGVGLDDDFLTLGGNSLLAARLAARLSATFGVNLTLRALLEHRTLRGMAALVDSLKWASDGPAGASGEQVEMTL